MDNGYGSITHPEIRLKEAFELNGEPLEALLCWRPRVAEALTVSDEKGTLFRARVLELTHYSARLLPFEEVGPERPRSGITLLQALPEKERMELIIQKTTELGVSRIIPFKSIRSTSIEERDAAQAKSHKWQEVALKAAKQSRAPFIPRVLPYRGFYEALGLCGGPGVKLILSERHGKPFIKDVLDGANGPWSSALVIVGPEGGFEDAELRSAEEAGFAAVSLGTRILRTETAAIAAVALLRFFST